MKQFRCEIGACFGWYRVDNLMIGMYFITELIINEFIVIFGEEDGFLVDVYIFKIIIV